MLFRSLTLILSSSVVLAQSGQNSEGPFLALAQGLSVDAQTSLPGGDAATLVFHGTDFTPNKPTPWLPNPSFPTLPDLGALPFMSVPGVDVDALSLGNDSVGATADGVMSVGPGSVQGLMFSVTRLTEGVNGGVIRGEFQAPGGAAADMFTYLQPGSLGPPEWTDLPMRSHDSTEISLDAPGQPGNIDAQDVYLGLFFKEAPHMSAFVPNIPSISVFFSVTNGSLGAVPSPWWGGTQPSGASIFRTDWVASSSVWTTPTVAYLPLHMGLLVTEDVDALALDIARGKALFSTQTFGAPVVRNPILFVDFTVPGANFVFRTQNNVPMSVRIGLRGGGIDDIDSLSGLEPTRVGPQLPMNHLVGSMLTDLLPGLPGRVSGATTLRLAPSATNEQIVTRMIGFPAPGAPTQGFAACAIALGNPFSSYLTVGTFFRDTQSAIAGNPQEMVITIPSSPSFGGVPLWFVWGSFDFQNNLFDLTPPVGLVL